MFQKNIFFSIIVMTFLAAKAQGGSLIPKMYLDRVEVSIHGKPYDYYSFSDRAPLELEVSGPGELTVITRWLFPQDFDGPEAYNITVVTNNAREDVFLFSARPSSKAKLEKSPELQPGLPKKITFDVPKGIHTYTFFLERPEGRGVLAHITLTKPWSWNWKTSLTNTYDDNVYRYSPGDIDNFVYHREDERFSMETYDDLIVSPSLTVFVTRRFSQNIQSRLRLSYRCNLFTKNGDRNYQTFSTFLKTTAFKKNYLQLGYFHIPEFHIRPYWDQDVSPLSSDDGEKYRECDFARNLFSIKLGREVFHATRVSVHYERDILYYNQYFTEYDTKANTFGFEIVHTFNPIVRTTFEYAFKMAEAKGYDEPGETKDLSDDSDISYDEDQFRGGIEFSISNYVSLPANVTLQYRLNKRYFTTEKSLEQDPFHAGRRDTIHRFSLMTEVEIFRSLSIIGTYEYQRRDVSSKEKERITEVKNYNRNRISVGFELTY